ncbi:hypothetical protein K3495_g5520 [Podosphaera aphanis]|nr:hypothetical protein K3495_g5520 [Podosphaera aphanis]
MTDFPMNDYERRDEQAPPSWVNQLTQVLSQQLSRSQAPQQEHQKSGNRPAHSQPHSEKFSGEDASAYPQFRSLLEAKLRIDAKAIGDTAERVWYGFGRLSGSAAKRLHPWMDHAKDTIDFTVEKFFDRLDKAYSDPDKIAKAIDKLNSIRQGNREFRVFLQDFEQTLLEAQAWD